MGIKEKRIGVFMKDKIIITYVYHSCYTVETKDLFIIFDYYKGKLNIPEDKEVIFISSHGHLDHYTSEILKLPDMENITYILSSDIGKLDRNENIIFIKKNTTNLIHESVSIKHCSPSYSLRLKFSKFFPPQIRHHTDFLRGSCFCT